MSIDRSDWTPQEIYQGFQIVESKAVPRAIVEWKFYRNGVIVPISEDEARHKLDDWNYLSDDRGAAMLLIDQLWAEIDRLRAASDGVISNDTIAAANENAISFTDLAEMMGAHEDELLQRLAGILAKRDPDPLAAAERAVIEAAIRWGTVRTGLEFRQAEEYLRSHVVGLLGLRAAQESGT